MLHRRRQRTHLKHLFILLAYPLLFLSVGYALYAQSISINARSNKPAYSATPSMSMSYTTTQTPSGSLIIYNITATVKNIGAGSVSRWQVKFNLPSDYSQFSCATGVTCTTSGATVTVNSGTGNSALAAGASTTFSFTFRSAVQNYQLQNLYVVGVESSFHTISGLTVTAARTSGSILSTSSTYQFTVTNNSGQTVKAWRITAGGWSNANNVTTMDARVQWIDLGTSLVIIGTPSIANGGNFVFTSQVSSGLLWGGLNNVTIVGLP